MVHTYSKKLVVDIGGNLCYNEVNDNLRGKCMVKIYRKKSGKGVDKQGYK